MRGDTMPEGAAIALRPVLLISCHRCRKLHPPVEPLDFNPTCSACLGKPC